MQEIKIFFLILLFFLCNVIMAKGAMCLSKITSNKKSSLIQGTVYITAN